MSTENIFSVADPAPNPDNHHPTLVERLRRGELIRSETIQATELIRLLREPRRVVSVPIRIDDSVIQGKLDLQYTTFKYGLSITDSVFESEVDLSFSTFERSVTFSGSCFKKRADFRAAHAKYDFEIDLATFDDCTSFEDLRVGEILRAQGAHFGSVNFERIQVAKSAFFCPSHGDKPRPTLFRGEVNFSDANIQGPIHLEGACFQKRAIFERVCFECVAVFECYQHNDQVHRTKSVDDHEVCHAFNHNKLNVLRTQFRDSVSFAEARIHGHTSFNGVQFRKEVSFEDSQIEGDLDFNPLNLGGKSGVIRVRFGGVANFRGAHVKGNASFNGAHFQDKADFEQFHAAGDMFFGALSHKDDFVAVRFDKEAIFYNAHAKGSADFTGARFKGLANFIQFKVGGNALFRTAQNQRKLLSARFDEHALFQNAHITETAEFDGTQFLKDTNFERLHAGGGVFFSTAQLPPELKEQTSFVLDDKAKRQRGHERFIKACRVDIEGLRTYGGGDDAADQAQIDKERAIAAAYRARRLSLAEVFIPVRFNGVANFLDADIVGTANFNGAQFRDQALFERLRISGTIFFRAAEYGRRQSISRICPVVFGGDVRFDSASIRGNAEFDGAQFLSQKDVVFERMEIYCNAYFRPYYANTTPVVFHGKVNFLGAYIKGDAEFSGAQFNSNAEFKGMKIDGDAYFDARHHLDNNVRLTGNEFNRVCFNSLADFSGIHFKNEAYFDEACFEKTAKFIGAEINGIASFDKATFKGETTFNEASFSSLSFVEDRKREQSRRKWFLLRPEASREKTIETWQFNDVVDMRGTKYEIIKVNLNDLARGLKKSPQYDLQPYNRLEKVLRAAGNDNAADYVYLERRHRERARLRNRSTESPSYLLRYMFNTAYWKLGNYGVHPIRLFVYSVLTILLGAAIFSLPGAVEPKEEELVTLQKQIKALTIEQAMNHAPDHSTAIDKEDPMNPVYKQESLGLTQAIGVSFSLFIPIVEIPSGHRWKPSEKPFFCVSDRCVSYALYGSFHRLLGALFVPLGVAALAVTLHRRAKLLHEAAE